jgi:hypothetical protein
MSPPEPQDTKLADLRLRFIPRVFRRVRFLWCSFWIREEEMSEASGDELEGPRIVGKIMLVNEKM